MHRFHFFLLILVFSISHFVMAENSHSVDANYSPSFANAKYVTPNVFKENIRPVPNGKNISGTINQGVRLKKLEEKDGWTKVRFEGWIYSPSLEKMEPEKNRELPDGDNLFTVNHWNWKKFKNMIRIQGIVENKSSFSFKDVKIITTLYDQNENELGSQYTYLQANEVDAYQLNGFKVFIRDVQFEGEPKAKFEFEYD